MATSPPFLLVSITTSFAFRGGLFTQSLKGLTISKKIASLDYIEEYFNTIRSDIANESLTIEKDNQIKE